LPLSFEQLQAAGDSHRFAASSPIQRSRAVGALQPGMNNRRTLLVFRRGDMAPFMFCPR
jgi:hypothetical protein